MVWRCHTDEIISGVLGQTYLTSLEIREVVMKTAEPVSVRGSTDRMVKIIYSVYAKEYLEQVAANLTHLNDDERTQLLGLLKTCSSPRFPLPSHYLVCIENHLFIVGIGSILNKDLELIFQSDRSDRTCVYS